MAHSYDPSADMAGMHRLLDEYTQATASMFRPDIDSAIDAVSEMRARLSRVLEYWNERSRKPCPSECSSQSSSAPGASRS